MSQATERIHEPVDKLNQYRNEYYTTRMHPAFQMQFTTAFMMSWSFGRKIRASS